MTEAERAALREANRKAMPKVTEFVDAMREEFGEVVVTYAAENGLERGQRS